MLTEQFTITIGQKQYDFNIIHCSRFKDGDVSTYNALTKVLMRQCCFTSVDDLLYNENQ